MGSKKILPWLAGWKKSARKWLIFKNIATKTNSSTKVWVTIMLKIEWMFDNIVKNAKWGDGYWTA